MMAKIKANRRLFFAFLLIIMVVSHAVMAQSLTLENLYTVENQVIDVTANNAVEARELAIEQAQQQAFTELAERLNLTNTDGSVAAYDPAMVSSLVKDFSVKNERSSGTRYKANFTIRFDERRIKRMYQTFYRDEMVITDDQTPNPVLVLPFLQVGSRLLLWEDPNPWRDAWQRAANHDGGIPIQVPLGDIEDVGDVPGAEIFEGSTGNIAAMASRYGAGGVYLIVAKSQGAAMNASDGMVLTTYQYNPTNDSIARVNEGTVNGGDYGFAEGVDSSMTFIQGNWKGNTTPNDFAARAVNYIVLNVQFSGLGEWVAVKQRLDEVSLIDDIRNDSLGQKNARLTVTYNGTMDDLRAAMAQRELMLADAPMLENGAYAVTTIQ